jgi:hypothetical protein
MFFDIGLNGPEFNFVFCPLGVNIEVHTKEVEVSTTIRA